MALPNDPVRHPFGAACVHVSYGKPIDGLDSDVKARQLWDRDFSVGTNNLFPRNFLSNDYGEVRTIMLEVPH